MTDNLADVIAELRRLLAKATPGPWPIKHSADHKRFIIGDGLVEGPGGYEVAEVYSDDCPSEQAEANAHLIAALCNNAELLLAAASAASAPGGQGWQKKQHDYISTACQHGLHDRCRRTCKFCATGCRCACHNYPLNTPVNEELAAAPEPAPAPTAEVPRPGAASSDRSWAESIVFAYQAAIADYENETLTYTRETLIETIVNGLHAFTNDCRKQIKEAQDLAEQYHSDADRSNLRAVNAALAATVLAQKGPPMAEKLTEAQAMVLAHIAEPRLDMFTGRINQLDIRKLSEPFRQCAIDLAMMEPQLVDIDGDFLFVTDAGRRAVASRGGA